MVYIEVPRIQAQADKIDNQLSIVLSQRPNMYAKTKERYKELAISLLSSVEKIAAILEEDSLACIDNKSIEFGQSEIDISDLSDAIKHASSRIDSCTKFISGNSSEVAININKETLRRYGQVLEQASNYNFSYQEATECAYILNKWFKARFSNYNKSNSFKYNIAYIPQWITDIIIMYGKYQSNNDSSSFIEMMLAWCDSLSNDDVKWAVPYEIYQLNKTLEPNNYTMNAVLIGDILMDEMLYLLTESSAPDLVANLDCYPVANKVKASNPALLPIIRTRLAKRDSLAKEYNLNISERRV